MFVALIRLRFTSAGAVRPHRFSRLSKQPEPDAVGAPRSRGAPPAKDKHGYHHE